MPVPVSTVTPFAVTLGHAAGAAVVAVTGELDLFGTPDFRRRLEEAVDAVAGPVVVDLTGCTFVDSAGAAALLAAGRRLRARRRELRLVVAHPTILRLFAVMGIDELFAVAPTRELALAGVAD